MENMQPNRPRTIHSEENIAAVIMIRRRSQQLGLPYGTTWRTLRKDLGLKSTEFNSCKNWSQPTFRIVTSWVLGLKQNFHIWAEVQTAMVQKLPLQLEKTAFWCGLWAFENINPYFFENERGQNVTLNVARDPGYIWFQQDSAICHPACESMTSLRENN